MTQNVKIILISPLHPFIYHFHIDFTILCPTPPSPPPQKKGKNKTRNLHNHCLPFLLDDYPGEIENNGYVFFGGGGVGGDKQGTFWSV